MPRLNQDFSITFFVPSDVFSEICLSKIEKYSFLNFTFTTPLVVSKVTVDLFLSFAIQVPQISRRTDVVVPLNVSTFQIPKNPQVAIWVNVHHLLLGTALFGYKTGNIGKGEKDIISLDAGVRDISAAVFLYHQANFSLLHVIALDHRHAVADAVGGDLQLTDGCGMTADGGVE